MKKSTGIYALYNTGNDKMYIGMAVNINRRMIKHYSYLKNNKHINKHLQQAYNKGQEIVPIVIYETKPGITPASLVRLEKHFIAEYGTFNDDSNGYNLTPGGEGFVSGENHPMFGKTHSKVAKQKISEAGKGRIMPKEARQRMSAALKGHIVTEETRQKLSKKAKGRIFSEEWRLKNSESHMGLIVTEETKKKISETLKGKYVGEKNSNYGKRYSEERKNQISEATSGDKNPFHGKIHTAETRKKMRSSRLAFMASNGSISEETRKKIGDAHRGEKNTNYGKHLSAETRQKISEAQKARCKRERETAGR